MRACLRPVRLTVALGAGLAAMSGALLAPPGALAAELGCVMRLSPGFGETIPANTPALSFYVRPAGVDVRVGPLRDLELRRGTTGAIVPVEVLEEGGGEFLVVPQERLLAGEDYRWKFRNPCFHDKLTESRFEVSPVVPLPASVGRLQASPFTKQARYNCRGSSFYVPGPAVHVQMSAYAAELVPFLPVTRFSARVDGKHWSRTTYGELLWGSFRPEPDLFQRRIDVFYATCGADVTGPAEPAVCSEQPLDLGPGRHRVQITAHIAGTRRDPEPTEIDIDIDCPLPDGGGVLLPELPPDVPDGGEATPRKSSACAVAPASSRGSPCAWLALVALLGLVARRRR